jgi:hypothetical protein
MNKEKFKKIGNIIFKIAGITCISFVVILCVYLILPNSKNSEQVSYDTDTLLTAEGGSRWSGLEEETEDYSEYSTSSESQLIKRGEISTVVDDLDEAMEAFDLIKDKYEGDITYSYEGGEGVEKYKYITLKIESKDFDKAFEEISDIEGEIVSSSTNTVDVTEQYVDLTSRLRNLESVEEKLLEIMEEAETVEDTLAVYEQLSSTQSQIEVLKGEIRYLDNQTDYSYITVRFSLSSIGAELTEGEWKPFGVLKEAFRTFLVVLKGVANVLIWILVFSPIVLVGFGIYLLTKKKGKKSKK